MTIRLLFDLQPCDLKYRVEFNSESDQRNTAVIDIVSCIPSVHGKPPEIWKPDVRLFARKETQLIAEDTEHGILRHKIPTKR